MVFLPTSLFLLLLMPAFMSFSHGTQDTYPAFLLSAARLWPATVGLIGIRDETKPIAPLARLWAKGSHRPEGITTGAPAEIGWDC